MKKLVILVLAALLLTSCAVKEPDVGLGDPIVTPDGTGELEAAYCYMGNDIRFFSEEAIIEYVQSEGNESMSAFDTNNESRATLPSNYYKFKIPPEGTEIGAIDFRPESVFIRYDKQTGDVGSEYLMIQYNPDYSCDIEIGNTWTGRPFPDESYIFEVDGIKYYISKWTSDLEPYFSWSAEWICADGFYLMSQFPYRFTAEEVLGYISDLERVEIAVPKAGDEVD